MKRIFTIFPLLSLLLLGLLAGCKKDDKLDDTIVGTDNFFSPAANAFVRIDPPAGRDVVFEWAPARAADGTVVLYEVLFDTESGDFSKPVFSQVSSLNGLDTKLSLSQGDLNRIANLAGIASSSRGRIKWTVQASKGTNVVRSSASRLLDVERPAGFATIPATVFITGSGTEGGAALAQAKPLKRLSSGVFEIYTQLSAGDVRFVDNTSGTPNSFVMAGAVLRDGATGTSPTTTPKVYRLKLDFNNSSATATEIVSVGLWIAAQNAVTVTLPYIGNGQWKILRTPIAFFQFSWGRDERYKFQFTERSAAGVVTNPYYGSTIADNQRATATTPPSYFIVVPGPDNQWDYTYKFRSEADNASIDITLKMQATGDYTHEITL